MLTPFFILAARSPSRQRAFRELVTAHVIVIMGAAWMLLTRASQNPAVNVGHLLLVTGVIEGAILIGWRLTQLPRSQSLEFLLVSQLPAWRLLLAEALVGLARLAFVTLSGLPILMFLVGSGFLEDLDVMPLTMMPFTWGAITGIGLAAWAYEPRFIRRWMERITLVGIIIYLTVGVLIGENLGQWVSWLPPKVGPWALWGFTAFHIYNPFAVLEFWMKEDPIRAEDRMLGLELCAVAAIGLMLMRAAGRLKAHFHELHYRPVADDLNGKRGKPGDRPLSWWAVRRVSEYSGRINLWLATGFGVIYASYTVAEPIWPPWLGRTAFKIFEDMGGIPGLATSLVVLASVPAAFQYGLWDSNAQNRCQRLELLLLTQLNPLDYWHAAQAAAWQRGRGYFAIAMLLWSAGAVAGKISIAAALAAASAGAVLWGLYFVLGFRAFARGMQANGMGLILTVVVPLATFGLFRMHWPSLAALLPPGSVFAPAAGYTPIYWLAGPVVGALLTLALGRQVQASCDQALRRWYELHHGRRLAE